MFYIRTEKNQYNIDVIIDVCDNIEFVNTTNLEWIELNSEQKPENGNYYYDGKIISIDSPDYSIIENIIFEYEEPLREERDKDLPVFVEEEDINDISDMIVEETENKQPLREVELTPEEKQKELELEKPKLSVYDDLESTQENLDTFTNNLSHLEKTISAYDSGNYTFSDNEVVFDPPIEHSDGSIQTKTIIPFSLTLEEQIQFLKDQRDGMIAFINRMKNDLQISD